MVCTFSKKMDQWSSHVHVPGMKKMKLDSFIDKTDFETDGLNCSVIQRMQLFVYRSANPAGARRQRKTQRAMSREKVDAGQFAEVG